jgi:hypothetical protein
MLKSGLKREVVSHEWDYLVVHVFYYLTTSEI